MRGGVTVTRKAHNLEIPGAIPGPATSQQKSRLQDGFSVVAVAREASELLHLRRESQTGACREFRATARRGRDRVRRRPNESCDR